MKSLLFLSALLALGSAPLSAEVSPTDRLAVTSGVSLWLNAWKSPGKADPAKLQPLYHGNVVTNATEAADPAKRSWQEFAGTIRDRSGGLAAAIGGENGSPLITVIQDRIVTSFPTGIRLVWEKTNGVWMIVEQNLPAMRAAMTALAE